jgi:hypothetical protein
LHCNKKVLQLKIGSNTKFSIGKACSVGLHKPFFLEAWMGGYNSWHRHTISKEDQVCYILLAVFE